MPLVKGNNSSLNLSGHRILVTSPNCKASVAVSIRQPNNNSLVTALPNKCGSVRVAPASGICPNFAYGV
ncbi:hypothetical protein PGB90_005635 [Kerria lacca]